MQVMAKIIADEPFYSLVLTIVEDRWCSLRTIVEWEKGFWMDSRHVVQRERMDLSDANNALECARRVAEIILQWKEG